MKNKWMQLREFLEAHIELRKKRGLPRPPVVIKVPAKNGAPPCDFEEDQLVKDLGKGDVDLTVLLPRADPIGDLLEAIAAALEIDPYLLDPYAALDVAGPVVLPPPKLKQDNPPPDFLKRHTKQGACYCSPCKHLAGSRLYPVCLILRNNPKGATPLHCHPGTELMVVLKGAATVTIPTVARPVSPPMQAENFRAPEMDIYLPGLLHFRSTHDHTYTRESKKHFRAWVFRELAPPKSISRWALLGRQLQSWRHYQKKSLQEIANRDFEGEHLSAKQLEEFENEGTLTVDATKREPSGDELKTLAEHYKIGTELLMTFNRQVPSDMVLQSALELANKREDEQQKLGGKRVPGVRYNWPSKFLAGSTIHPGLLTIAPFSQSPVHNHPGTEIVLVIHGSAEIRFPGSNTSVGTIKEGQLVHFDSTWPHTVVNTGRHFLFAWVLREMTFERQ